MDDHTLDASVRVDLKGNLKKNSRRYADSLGNMSRNGSRHLNRLRRTTAKLDRTMGRMGNRWVALATGGAIVAAGKKVLSFDATLTRMQTSAQLTDEQAAKLKKTLQSVANDTDIRVPIDQLTAAVAQFLDKTGDADFAIENMRNFGLMMQGLGVEASSSGLLMAQFWEDSIKNPDDVLGVMDRLFAQFSRGSVSVKQIASVSAELFSAVQRKGPEAITDVGALAQVYAKTAGNANKAQTAIVGTVRALNTAKTAAKLDKALAKNGLAPIREASGLIRPLPQLLLDITKAANNSIPILSTVFDTEALNGLKSLVDPKNKKLLLEMINGTIEQNLTLNASAKNAKTASAAIDALFNSGRRFADLNLSAPIQDLADSLSDLSDEEMIQIMETAKDVALAFGGIIVGLTAMKGGLRLIEAGQSLIGPALAKKGAGNLAAGIAGVKPIPVFVVNNISGLGGGGAGGRHGRGKIDALKGVGSVSSQPGGKVGKAGKLSKLAKIGGIGGISRAAGLGAATLGGGALALAGAGASLYLAGSGGFALGSLISKALEGGDTHDAIGSAIANTLAFFGNDAAQQAVNRIDQAEKKVTVELELSSEAAKALTPKNARNESNAIDLEVSGSMGAL